MNAKNIVITVLVIVLIGAVVLFMRGNGEIETTEVPSTTETPIPVEPDGGIGDGAEPLDEMMEEERGAESVIGNSADGSDIMAYHYGEGETELLFVGGIHGGYSWNTSLVAFEMIDYLDENPEVVPENISVTIIPVLNPDGLNTTVGSIARFEASDALTASEADRVAGRFNANDVDLNRNFDCKWAPESIWRDQEVSGGATAFSEPEAVAIKEYVEKYDPAAAVVWFSSEGKVYPSACAGSPGEKSVELAATYATAAGYGSDVEFDAYAITGDMVNWMAGEGIPAISILLTDHKGVEWNKNKAGIEAVLKTYAE